MAPAQSGFDEQVWKIQVNSWFAELSKDLDQHYEVTLRSFLKSRVGYRVKF